MKHLIELELIEVKEILAKKFGVTVDDIRIATQLDGRIHTTINLGPYCDDVKGERDGNNE